LVIKTVICVAFSSDASPLKMVTEKYEALQL